MGIGIRSVKSRCYRARSVGSCILATGVLPLLPLHCSCQGAESLTHINARVPHLHPEQCNARTPDIAGISAELHGAPRLSHGVMHFAEGAAKQDKKTVSLTSSAHTGAEGQHIAYLAGRY